MPSRAPEEVRLLASLARLTSPKSAISGWPELVDQDIRGLEVAVDHPLAMGVIDRPGDRGHQAGRCLVVVAIASQVMRQVAAANQLHAEEGMPLMPADLEDRHDVGMVQVSRRLGLGAEPADLGLRGELARQDHLERDHAVEADLASPVDHAHAAAGQLAQELVVAKPARRDRARLRAQFQSPGCGPLRLAGMTDLAKTRSTKSRMIGEPLW